MKTEEHDQVVYFTMQTLRDRHLEDSDGCGLEHSGKALK